MVRGIMSIMADIKQFPVDRAAETVTDKRLSIGFAAASIVFSVLVTVTSGAWITGQIVGAYNIKLDNLTAQWQRDHDDWRRQTDELTTLVRSLGNQTATESAQIEALKQSLIQERSERLDFERR